MLYSLYLNGQTDLFFASSLFGPQFVPLGSQLVIPPREFISGTIQSAPIGSRAPLPGSKVYKYMPMGILGSRTVSCKEISKLIDC